MASTAPFNLIDEFAYLAEMVGGQMALHFEVRVARRIELAALRAAVAAAISVHPMARARMAPARWRDRSWTWEVPDDVDVEPVMADVGEGDAGLAEARQRALAFRVPLGTSPPFRVWLVHHNAGDVLVFAVNHTPLDALAFRRLLVSIGRAYSHDDDPVPAIDPLSVRDIGALLALPPVSPVQGALAIARLARDPAGPPGRIAKDGATRQRGVGATVRAIDRAGASAPGLTITDVLVAALHRAVDVWGGGHGADLARISTYVPINVRPPEWRDEIVGNFSIATSVTTTRDQRRDVADLTDVVAARMHLVRDRSAVAELSPAMFAMSGLPLWVRRGAPLLQPLAGRALDTSVLTNLGHVDRIDFGAAGAVTEFWGSAPIRMPLGAGIMVTGIGERLLLGLRYEHRQFSPEAAERFLDTYVAAIDEVVASSA